MSWPPRSSRSLNQPGGGAPGSSSLPLGGHDPMSMGVLRDSLNSMSKVVIKQFYIALVFLADSAKQKKQLLLILHY